ncbi:MAG TPA: hypothetical protein VND97_01865 [Beijerinckiaceae bacterium]|nr:hypothetical protein [Beijerinckiaceae bacterium]
MRGSIALRLSCAVFATALLTAAARAQPSDQSNPLRRAFGVIGLSVKRGPMPGFVERTQPAPGTLRYVPIGGPRPEPSAAALTPAQIRADEAELAATRSRDDRLSGRRPIAVNAGSAAGAPIRSAKKKKARCLLTCRIRTNGIGRRSSMR